jgi:uncharacterized membrane protein
MDGQSRRLPLLYVIGGGIGFIAAFTLLIEKIALLKDPAYVPTCSFNPILSCGSIMKTDQAEVFGFPNPMIGIAAFASLVTIGVLLLSGVELKRWLWIGLQIGTTFGVAFVHWLIYQSLYVIGALCPYCMVVWVVTIPLFWYTTLCNLSNVDRGVVRVAREFHSTILILWYLIIVVLIGFRFWDYWSTLIQ